MGLLAARVHAAAVCIRECTRHIHCIWQRATTGMTACAMHAMSQGFVPWTTRPRASAASTCGRADGDRGVADKGDAAPAPGLQGLPRHPAAVDAVLRDGVRVGGAAQHRLEAQRHVFQHPLDGLQMAKIQRFADKDIESVQRHVIQHPLGGLQVNSPDYIWHLA